MHYENIDTKFRIIHNKPTNNRLIRAEYLQNDFLQAFTLAQCQAAILKNDQ